MTLTLTRGHESHSPMSTVAVKSNRPSNKYRRNAAHGSRGGGDIVTLKKKPDAPGTKEWYKPFILQLSETPNVAAACAFAGIARQTAYMARRSDARFAQAWDDCINASIDHLEEVAFKRAEESSDLLTIFLLKSHRPEKYRETSRHEVTGPDDGPLEITPIPMDYARVQEVLKTLRDVLPGGTDDHASV